MATVQGSLLLVYALIAIIALVVLIARFKVNPFITLMIVSVALALAVGMPMTPSSSRSKPAWATRSAILRSSSGSARCSAR